MLFTLEVRVTGIWNLAKLLRKLIDVQFLRFSGSGVSRSCIVFGVLAGRLCFVREVALFKLEKNTFGLNLDLSTPSRSVYDCEDTWINSA